MSGKFALIIANTEYADSKLAKLTAPGKDADAFAEILKAPDISAFDDVNTLFNQPEPTSRRAIAKFFANRKPDDLLLLYFSGHGVRDEQGRLFLATTDTDHSMLDATAIPSEFITRQMDNSRSKRQVLILDCCNSGAFAYGTKGATGTNLGTASAFEGTGYGRVVLTATDTTQFAWEGDKIIGEETTNSLFTHFLVKGLEGEADDNGDGTITVDDLYDYAYNQIVSRTPKQKPGKWIYKEQGQIVLTTRVRPQTIKPQPLDADLEQDLQSTRNYVREAAVKELGNILNGKNLGKALSAELNLQRVAENDDSRSIASMAAQLLEEYRAKKGIKPEPKKTITLKIEEPLAVNVKIPPKKPVPKKLVVVIGLVVIIGMIAAGIGLLAKGGMVYLAAPSAISTPTRTPTPNPTTIPTLPYLIMSDSFDSNINGWDTVYNSGILSSVNQSIQGGKYIWQANAIQAFVWRVVPNGKPALSDFSVTVDAQVTEGLVDRDFGVVLRYQRDKDENYYFGIDDKDQKYRFVFTYGHDFKNILGWTYSNAILPGQVNRLSVVATGSHFTFYINNQYVDQTDDSTLASGNVGLGISLFKPGDKATFEFDNFELRSSTAPLATPSHGYLWITTPLINQSFPKSTISKPSLVQVSWLKYTQASYYLISSIESGCIARGSPKIYTNSYSLNLLPGCNLNSDLVTIDVLAYDINDNVIAAGRIIIIVK